MKLKKFLPVALLIAAISIMAACKSGEKKDAEIKTAIEEKFKASPDMAGITVAVTDAVATISGEVKDEATKAGAGTAAGEVKDVKSVTNNITVSPPPPPPVPVVVNTEGDALIKGINDALKDFPGVQASVVEGKIKLTGEIAKGRWIMLKQALDKLKPKGYELTGLTIK